MNALKEKLEKELGWEVTLLFQKKHSFKECYKAVEAYTDKLMEDGEEYVFLYATSVVLDDSLGELWIKFYQ